jgi:hypothetical protein
MANGERFVLRLDFQTTKSALSWNARRSVRLTPRSRRPVFVCPNLHAPTAIVRTAGPRGLRAQSTKCLSTLLPSSLPHVGGTSGLELKADTPSLRGVTLPVSRAHVYPEYFNISISHTPLAVCHFRVSLLSLLTSLGRPPCLRYLASGIAPAPITSNV